MSVENIQNLNICEKAYIAGLLYKYKITINTINYKVLDVFINIYPVYYFNKLSSSNKSVFIDISNNISYIEVIDNIIRDFPNFPENAKLMFIRGIYEANNNLYIQKTDNISSIIDTIKNDYIVNYDILQDDIIYIRNKHRFYKKIYACNNDLSCLCNGLQNKYKKDISNPKIKVFKTSSDAVMPSKAFDDDAGYDLTIISKIKDFNSKTSLYDTGIKIEVEEGYYTEIVPRSSISKSGYILSNSVGIIDNSYRGNLYIALTKIADDAIDITYPFKCCQLIIKKQEYVNLEEVSEKDLNITKRNEGGFGSTDNK